MAPVFFVPCRPERRVPVRPADVSVPRVGPALRRRPGQGAGVRRRPGRRRAAAGRAAEPAGDRPGHRPVPVVAPGDRQRVGPPPHPARPRAAGKKGRRGRDRGGRTTSSGSGGLCGSGAGGSSARRYRSQSAGRTTSVPCGTSSACATDPSSDGHKATTSKCSSPARMARIDSSILVLGQHPCVATRGLGGVVCHNAVRWAGSSYLGCVLLGPDQFAHGGNWGCEFNDHLHR